MILMAILQRWLLFGWVGRLGSLIGALYGSGWVLGNLGWHAAARELGGMALFILGILLTALFLRLIWRDATSHHRR